MSRSDSYRVVFFNPDQHAISHVEEFFNEMPPNIRIRFLTVLDEVAKCPPFKFRGGGLWEAMKGSMTGWFEVRITSGKENHYRLYCVLDSNALNCEESLLVVIDGRVKKYLTVLPEREYGKIRELGQAYFSSNPRLI